VPHLRLLRPPWTPGAGDRWHEVDDLVEAAAWLAAQGVRSAFLATGRQDVAPFANLPGVRFVLRSIDPPGPLALPDATFVLARGPFDIAAERALLRQHGVELVVTRNSGGEATRAKLDAARELGLPVVMVRRPPPPPDAAVVETVADAEAWVRGRA
jgi:precorrin-6A/cobalt-precorrin-6A reductase